MTLTQLREKRTFIKNRIEEKHNDWMEYAINGEDEAADICARTIAKLHAAVEQVDVDIINLKEELIKGAL